MESILTTSQHLILMVEPSLRMYAFKMDAESQHCSPPALLSPRQTTSLSSQACSNSLLIVSLLLSHLLQSISTQQPEGSFTGGLFRMESETMSLLCSVPSDASHLSQDQSNNLPTPTRPDVTCPTYTTARTSSPPFLLPHRPPCSSSHTPNTAGPSLNTPSRKPLC